MYNSLYIDNGVTCPIEKAETESRKSGSNASTDLLFRISYYTSCRLIIHLSNRCTRKPTMDARRHCAFEVVALDKTRSVYIRNR